MPQYRLAYLLLALFLSLSLAACGGDDDDSAGDDDDTAGDDDDTVGDDDDTVGDDDDTVGDDDDSAGDDDDSAGDDDDSAGDDDAPLATASFSQSGSTNAELTQTTVTFEFGSQSGSRGGGPGSGCGGSLTKDLVHGMTGSWDYNSSNTVAFTGLADCLTDGVDAELTFSITGAGDGGLESSFFGSIPTTTEIHFVRLVVTNVSLTSTSPGTDYQVDYAWQLWGE